MIASIQTQNYLYSETTQRPTTTQHQPATQDLPANANAHAHDRGENEAYGLRRQARKDMFEDSLERGDKLRVVLVGGLTVGCTSRKLVRHK